MVSALLQGNRAEAPGARRQCGRSPEQVLDRVITLLDVIVSLCMAAFRLSLLSFALRSRPESATPLQSCEGSCPHLHWSKISTKSRAA